MMKETRQYLLYEILISEWCYESQSLTTDTLSTVLPCHSIDANLEQMVGQCDSSFLKVWTKVSIVWKMYSFHTRRGTSAAGPLGPPYAFLIFERHTNSRKWGWQYVTGQRDKCGITSFNKISFSARFNKIVKYLADNWGKAVKLQTQYESHYWTRKQPKKEDIHTDIKSAVLYNKTNPQKVFIMLLLLSK